MSLMSDDFHDIAATNEQLPRRIVIVTDAWKPQMNGVVRTLDSVIERLRDTGRDILVISPDRFRSFPCPTYPEIRLALASKKKLGQMIADFAPDAIHLSTEGPLCWTAQRWCMERKLAFTTAYHTQFPDYLARRTGLPPKYFWPYIRKFHAASEQVMVSTQSIADTLADQGIGPTVRWSRGVDFDNFHPGMAPPPIYAQLPRPIKLYVGRISVEKNIQAFLDVTYAGSKVVVGDGPALSALRQKYPDAHFVGRKGGTELGGYYAGADVFVFPSRTDTFGLVNIEALACGTPVAAYPVAGPIDILTEETGAMHDRLERAITAALWLEPGKCATHAQNFSWQASAQQFLEGLVFVEPKPDLPSAKPCDIWADAA